MSLLHLSIGSRPAALGCSSGQISLGHDAFFAVGAYTAGVLLSHQWLPFYVTMPAAMAVCGLFGLLFGLPATRLAGPYLALATFTLAVALPQLLKPPLLEPWTGGVSGLSLDPPAAPFGIEFLQPDAWNLLLTAVWTALIYGVLRRLLNEPVGLAWITLRDHPTAALAVGVDVDVRKWRATALAVSAATVGAAGAINTGLTHSVSPDSFPIFLSLSLLVGVALAGPSGRVGIFVAAVFLFLRARRRRGAVARAHGRSLRRRDARGRVCAAADVQVARTHGCVRSRCGTSPESPRDEGEMKHAESQQAAWGQGGRGDGRNARRRQGRRAGAR